MKTKFLGRSSAVFVLSISLFVLISGSFSAVAEEHKDVVRVGYVPNYGTMESNVKKINMGYGYDYLEEISKHTDWEYELVPMEWSEGLTQLENGEIDLFGPMQRSPEREEKYDFHNREMGFEYGAIFASDKNDKVFYEDSASFNGMRVASTPGNIFEARLNEYCEENGVEIEYVYSEAGDYERYLNSGQIDAFVAGSTFELENTVVIEKFEPEPYYYATTKGNQKVLDGMNMALEEIYRENPYFAMMLDKKYYGEKSINMPAFTREETECIKRNPKLRVVGDPSWLPIEYFDKKSGSYKGINIDIMEEISENSGIEFEYIKTDSYRQSMDMIRSGKADLILGFGHSPTLLDITYTDPFLEYPLMIVANKGTDLSKDTKVAMRYLDAPLDIALKSEYPNFTHVYASNTEDMTQQLKSIRVDAIMISTYAFDEIARKESIENFITMPSGISFGQRIGVSNSLDSVLISVMDKSIRRVTGKKISAILFSNTVGKDTAIPISKIIKENAYSIILVLVIFFAILLYVITESQKSFQRMAYVDSLTSLPTLAKFKLDTMSAIKSGDNFEYRLVSLDINEFKYINDSFGYVVGNDILTMLAGYFKQNLKSGELIGRAGADNFVFLIKEAPVKESIVKASMLHGAREELRHILPMHYNVTFSVGVYEVADKEEDFSLMLDKANFARKSVKGGNCGSIAKYTADMDAQVAWKKEVTISMERALSDNEFEVYLQPKYRLCDEKLVGAEALVRWNHPEKGLLFPARFIPIFEQNGFIRKIDLYVFERTCKLIKEKMECGEEVVPISVNLSRLHIHNPALVEELMQIVDKHGVPTKYIELELTESLVMNNIVQLIEIIKTLKNEGFKISIDDFGSGYSSLNILRDLPVDVLKIDKGFLGESSDVENGRIIIEAVTKMAKSLNLVTVAEGVETEGQAKMLLDMDCDIAQGYYYAKPMPIPEFEKLLKRKDGGKEKARQGL